MLKDKCQTNNNTLLYIVAMLALITVLFMANIATGAIHIPLDSVINILQGEDGEKATWRYIIMESRLPQAATATLCGASLAVCGLMLQTAFNNPLAGPSIFGINSGASLGVAIVILLLNGSITTDILTINGFMAIIIGAFLGATIIIAILLLFARIIHSNVVLLIIGIMIGYLSSSAISLLNFFATEQGVTSYVMWGMGNFSSVSMRHMPVFASLTIMCVMASLLLIKPLNALLLGEKYAENLGFNTKRVRVWLLLLTGIQTAVTTAYCGPVSFIGLAVPHITRMILDTDNHQQLMPCTILMGAAIALICNMICTVPSNGTVIPLNAVTPLIGAPVIIYILIKQRKGY